MYMTKGNAIAMVLGAIVLASWTSCRQSERRSHKHARIPQIGTTPGRAALEGGIKPTSEVDQSTRCERGGGEEPTRNVPVPAKADRAADRERHERRTRVMLSRTLNDGAMRDDPTKGVKGFLRFVRSVKP